ncbi:hypothetical protein JTB14_007322 [Gonioctena quinquepunctata]|nr:hypothetical protein JTB14_007322 [Gonioctena quinquepunctata]
MMLPSLMRRMRLVDCLLPRDNATNKSTNIHKEMSSTSVSPLCKVRLEEDMKVVFMPCRHLACCEECSVKLDNCAECRTAIGYSFKVLVS